MSFYALALLCPFAATTFAAVVQGKWSVSSRLIVVCSFPLGALWLRPEPAWVGVLVAVAAGLQLAWPQLPWLAVAVGGLTAGLWGGILTSQGLVMPLAWMVAASFPVASAVLSAHRPEFAPAALKEEALLAALAFGVLVATGPTVASGWDSASILNLESVERGRQVVEVWVILLSGGFVVLGGWFSLRRCR